MLKRPFRHGRTQRTHPHPSPNALLNVPVLHENCSTLETQQSERLPKPRARCFVDLILVPSLNIHLSKWQRERTCFSYTTLPVGRSSAVGSSQTRRLVGDRISPAHQQWLMYSTSNQPPGQSNKAGVNSSVRMICPATAPAGLTPDMLHSILAFLAILSQELGDTVGCLDHRHQQQDE